MNGAPVSPASLRAISVFPTPVGPIMMMFFGATSCRIDSGSWRRRQRFRTATATARFASAWPTMYLSSSETICLGVRCCIGRMLCTPTTAANEPDEGGKTESPDGAVCKHYDPSAEPAHWNQPQRQHQDSTNGNEGIADRCAGRARSIEITHRERETNDEGNDGHREMNEGDCVCELLQTPHGRFSTGRVIVEWFRHVV